VVILVCTLLDVAADMTTTAMKLKVASLPVVPNALMQETTTTLALMSAVTAPLTTTTTIAQHAALQLLILMKAAVDSLTPLLV